MSTKIYNGFRLKTANLNEIHQHLMGWRRELEALHKKALAQLHANIAVGLIDQLSARPGRHVGKSPISEAYSLIADRQYEVRKTQRRDPSVDFEFSLSLMPHSSGLYGIVFTEQQAWLSRWLDKDFVEDFSYWDNTDPLEGIDDEVWANRGTVWNEILNPAIASAPSMAGFTAECTHSYTNIGIDDIAAEVPDFEVRVARTADTLLFEDAYARHQASLPVSLNDTGAALSTMRETRAWLRSDDGRQELERQKADLRNILRQTLTTEDLIANISAQVD